MRVDIDAIARKAVAALDTGRPIVPFSARFPDFSLDDAYRVTAAVKQLWEQRGATAIGRKIGFTNRTIWAEYGVYAPIWGYVYDRTVASLAEIGETFALAGLLEPRIEPEIIFGLASAPKPGMDEAALLDCIGWVAHGFEIVQSIFPGWKFSAPDTVAAFGLHAALLIDQRRAIVGGNWLEELARFDIDLKRDDVVVDRGKAANVLGGPLSALRHLVELLARDPVNPPLEAGEIVTTGTLTRAMSVARGEHWSTALRGIALDPIELRFR
jgi:2-oxo-3-hexenedioate decarboxylase